MTTNTPIELMIMKFLKHYALEIYSVTAMFLIVCAAIFVEEMTVIQKYTVFLSFIFILHEWEEGYYPGGFLDLISNHVLQMDIDQETKLGSRLITGVFLLVYTIMPFFWGDRIMILTIAMSVFCIFEGLIHVAGIKLFRLANPYTPGMVTAEIELVAGISLTAYLATNHLASWYDYTFAPLVFIASFAIMQRTLMATIGLCYKDMLKNIRRLLRS